MFEPVQASASLDEVMIWSNHRDRGDIQLGKGMFEEYFTKQCTDKVGYTCLIRPKLVKRSSKLTRMLRKKNPNVSNIYHGHHHESQNGKTLFSGQLMVQSLIARREDLLILIAIETDRPVESLCAKIESTLELDQSDMEFITLDIVNGKQFGDDFSLKPRYY